MSRRANGMSAEGRRAEGSGGRGPSEEQAAERCGKCGGEIPGPFETCPADPHGDACQAEEPVPAAAAAAPKPPAVVVAPATPAAVEKRAPSPRADSFVCPECNKRGCPQQAGKTRTRFGFVRWRKCSSCSHAFSTFEGWAQGSASIGSGVEVVRR